jgi:hypothetical protein
VAQRLRVDGRIDGSEVEHIIHRFAGAPLMFRTPARFQEPES